MASGCACVASDVAGARAQIDNGITGLLVPPRNPRALGEAINWLINHETERESMQQAARAHVLESHTLAAFANRLEAAYADMLGRGRGDMTHG